MVPQNHFAGLVFFIFHIKHRHVANIDKDSRGGVVRNTSPGLYHVLPEKNWVATRLTMLFYSSTFLSILRKRNTCSLKTFYIIIIYLFFIQDQEHVFWPLVVPRQTKPYSKCLRMYLMLQYIQ